MMIYTRKELIIINEYTIIPYKIDILNRINRHERVSLQREQRWRND